MSQEQISTIHRVDGHCQRMCRGADRMTMTEQESG
jgi:hypothetical protein